METKYDAKQKRFVIDCAFHENGRIAGLPNKRWQKRHRVWYAPVLHRNAQFLLDSCHDTMTDEAVEVATAALQRGSVKIEPFPVGYQHKTNPYQHQREALDFAWCRTVHALFMEMGTGKSKIAIDLHAARMQTGEIDTWVVFCPHSIRLNWESEIRTHSDIQNVCIIDSSMSTTQKRDLQRMVRDPGGLVLIAGYESLQQKHRGGSVYSLLVDTLADRGNFAVTMDESHYVKNPDANRTKNVAEVAALSKFRQIMTGTPIAQNVLDLFQQFEILDPNIIGLGSWYSFRNRYAIMGGYENREIIGYDNLDELMDLIRPYTFQRTKADTLDLPEKLYSRRNIKMSREQIKMYKQVRDNPEIYIGGDESTGSVLGVDQVLAEYNALQQVTGGFIKYDFQISDVEIERRTEMLVESGRNPKILELIDIAEENPNSKMVVWAKFRQEIADIVQVLRTKYGDESVVEYHGGVPMDQRPRNMRWFKEGQARFFVANQQTGGTGLTINESNLVVYFSNSFKLVDRVQSEDRNHRIGQKNDVLYIDLVCTGTVDEDIITALRDKKDVADYVRGSLARAH